MIYHNHTTIDIKYHVTEYDIAPNIHLLVACSARGSLIAVTAIDLTPTLAPRSQPWHCRSFLTAIGLLQPCAPVSSPVLGESTSYPHDMTRNILHLSSRTSQVPSLNANFNRKDRFQSTVNDRPHNASACRTKNIGMPTFSASSTRYTSLPRSWPASPWHRRRKSAEAFRAGLTADG